MRNRKKIRESSKNDSMKAKGRELENKGNKRSSMVYKTKKQKKVKQIKR